jgi:GTP cyclohydrolase I
MDRPTHTPEDLAAVRRLLGYIGEDPDREGLLETPARFLKAWEEYTRGYRMNPEDILKSFEDGAESVDEMVIVRDIPVYSLCEHHVVPFFGVAAVAYIPSKKIVGLSKLARCVDYYARRLQNQERITTQVAERIQKELSPLGVGVVLKGRHMCMEMRGVRKPGTYTTTCCLLGVFKEQSEVRSEFLSFIKGSV